MSMPAKSPKAVKDFFEANADVSTVEDVKKILETSDTKEKKRLFGALSYSLKNQGPEQANKYGKLTTDKERTDSLASSFSRCFFSALTQHSMSWSDPSLV